MVLRFHFHTRLSFFHSPYRHPFVVSISFGYAPSLVVSQLCILLIIPRFVVRKEVTVQYGLPREVTCAKSNDELSVECRHRIALFADCIVNRRILLIRCGERSGSHHLKVIHIADAAGAYPCLGRTPATH